MATGRQPDPRRRKTAHQHATYLAVKPGEKHPAYIAGELYGCYTHRTSHAQPCLSDVTNDALECPLCKGGLVPEWRGYVPLWDRDWTLRYVLISEEYFATTDAIGFHAKVSVSRAKDPKSPLVIREEVMLTRDLPNKAPWRDSVSMLPICLTLWKNAALVAWVNANKPLAAGAQTMSAPEPKPAPKPVPAPTKAFVGPRTDEPEEIDFEAQRNRILGKLKKPSTNGKH